MHYLPFGRHRGTDPRDVSDTGYLLWFLTTCRPSMGLRTAIRDALQQRGFDLSTLPPPPPPQRPQCPNCRGQVEAPRCTWQQDRAGHRRIRATCPSCQSYCGFVPLVEPFVSEADAAASST